MLILIPNIDVKMLKLMQYFIIYDETIQSNQDIIILTGKKNEFYLKERNCIINLILKNYFILKDVI